MKSIKNIIALICAISIVISSTSLSFASDASDAYRKATFWDIVFGFGGGERGGTFGTGGFGGSSDWNSADEMKTAYNNYVSTLPASGYTSSGALLWQPNWETDTKDWCVVVSGTGGDIEYFRYESFTSRFENNSTDLVIVSMSGPCFTVQCLLQPKLTCSVTIFTSQTFSAPVSGRYTCLTPAREVKSYQSSNNDRFYNDEEKTYAAPTSQVFSAGNGVPIASRIISGGFGWIYQGVSNFYTPVYSIIPSETTVNNNYTINTRVNNFNGDYYDSVTNNYYNNTTIVNETTNNYYDMTTNTNYTMKSWSYDYQSRTYFITLEDGTTVTVQFSDDGLIITNNDVSNSYQYVIKNNGGSDPDTPTTCKHDWQETIDKAPTCLEGGHASYTCSKCGETYEQILAAKGHDWTVKEHVNTVYDSDGTVLTQGHTLYECSVCGEQFYTDTGAPPPDVSGSSSIIAWLTNFRVWLGDRLTVNLDAMTTLFDSLVDKLQIIVDNSQTSIDNVTNVVIDQTNNAYHIFYLTGEDGTEHSIGEATGGMLSASGKLLNFLYRLCVEGALSKVDDSIDGMSSFYFDSSTGTEGSIWD